MVSEWNCGGMAKSHLEAGDVSQTFEVIKRLMTAGALILRLAGSGTKSRQLFCIGAVTARTGYGGLAEIAAAVRACISAWQRRGYAVRFQLGAAVCSDPVGRPGR